MGVCYFLSLEAATFVHSAFLISLKAATCVCALSTSKTASCIYMYDCLWQ